MTIERPHSIKKKHHYVPASLLANFTEQGHRHSVLHVTDLEQGRPLQGKPDNVGCKNNLYRVELSNENNDPNAIEDAFSKLESMAAPVINEIISKQQLPSTTNGFNILLNYIALLETRTPMMINHRSNTFVEIMDLIMRTTFSSKERWNNITSRMIADGKMEPNPDITYEQMCYFIESDKYQMDINQNYKLKQILDSSNIILKLLAYRRWSLLVCRDLLTRDPDLGGFICSDNPVTLVSTVKLPPFYSPGFGMPNTEVTIPLSKACSLNR